MLMLMQLNKSTAIFGIDLAITIPLIYAWLDPVGWVKITKTSTDVVIASDASTAIGIDAAITSHLPSRFSHCSTSSHSPTLLLCSFSHYSTTLLLCSHSAAHCQDWLTSAWGFLRDALVEITFSIIVANTSSACSNEIPFLFFSPLEKRTGQGVVFICPLLITNTFYAIIQSVCKYRR